MPSKGQTCLWSYAGSSNKYQQTAMNLMFRMLKAIINTLCQCVNLVVEQIILVVIVIKCQLLKYWKTVLKFDLNNEVNAVSITTFHFSFKIKLPRLSSIAVQPGLRHMVCSTLNHDVFFYLHQNQSIYVCIRSQFFFFFSFTIPFTTCVFFCSILCVIFVISNWLTNKILKPTHTNENEGVGFWTLTRNFSLTISTPLNLF